MKKIINGKTYNTKTATEIGHYWNGLSITGFRNVSEWLYVTKNGAYFIYGRGGAMTDWSEPCGDARCGGSGIRPLTESEALIWMSSYCDADDTERQFKHLLEEA